MSAAARAALVVEGLRVDLTGKGIDIVAEVDLRLAPGEVLGLVGESGSGKSTLGLALLGYAKAGAAIAGGRVEIDGVDMLGLGEEELRRYRGHVVSYVAQDPASALNPALRIGTQLMEVLETHGYGDGRAARRERVREVLEDTRLPSDEAFLRRYPHQLSGGQQQRVCLAMAFACRPRVVVLDEPTTGLDVTTQAHVLRTVRRLCEEHETAAVYVTHDLAVVKEVAHRVAVMYAGRLVEIGSAPALTEAPAHPYTRRLVEAVPDPKLRRELVGIPGRVAPLGQRPAVGCVFAARCDFAEPECVAQAIELTGVEDGHLARCRRIEAVRALPSALAAPSVPAPAASAGAQAPALAVERLTARYGEHEVLHGVDLAVPRGSCLALVGESGSGKTTLARSIAGLHLDAAGSVRLPDAEVPFGARNRPVELRRRIQYVFQNPYGSLNPRKCVGELLEQPLRLFHGLRGRAARERACELLEQVSLDARFSARYPAQLSGGERQRVAIARALATEPEVLICDEVTSALDVSVQASILRLLARLQADAGVTLLFVTHNFGVVRAIADTVAVLQGGRIVAHGEMTRVLDDPQDAYTTQLLADTPTLAGGATELTA